MHRQDDRRWSRRRFLTSSCAVTTGLVTGAFGRTVSSALATPPDPIAGGGSLGDAPLGEITPLLQDLVREMERRVPYASALLIRRGGTAISMDDHTREVDDLFPSQGVVFTVHNGGWFEEAATNDLTPDSLHDTALNLARSARIQAGGQAVDPGTGGERHFVTACEIDPSSLALEDRFARVEERLQRARAIFPDATNCQVDYTDQTVEEIFVNRTKAWTQNVIRVRGGVSFHVGDGSRRAVNFGRRGGTGGLELLTLTDDDVAAIARDARALLDAGPVEPGPYEIVMDGSVAGTLAHESFGHGVELDMFVKDRALAEQFVGKRVGSDLVNITDDPSLPHAFGSYFFDDEGELAAPTRIVENGIFQRGLSDLMSAGQLQAPRTGNGRRQGFGNKAYARMSNTFFEPGTSSVDELVQGVGHGFLVESFTHGMEDPKGWGILVSAHLGREIRDGKLTGRLVSPIGITGYVPEVLGSVNGVSRDFTTVPATCGKGHKEFVAVSTGGPHLRLSARLA